MKTSAAKQWNGGVKPELSEIDKAYVDHVSNCSVCRDGPLDLCVKGRKLYADIRGQYEKKINDARIAAHK